MSILEIEDELFQIETVQCDQEELRIRLKSGLSVSTPLKWYERLQNASQAELSNYRILPFGDAVHWPDLDEDLSVKGILQYAAKQNRDLKEHA